MKYHIYSILVLIASILFSCNTSTEYTCTEELTQCFEKALSEEFKDTGTDDVGYKYLISNYRKDTLRNSRIIITSIDTIDYFAYFSKDGWFALEDKTLKRFSLKELGNYLGSKLRLNTSGKNPILSPEEKYNAEVKKIILNISDQLNSLYFRAKNDRGVFPGEVEKKKLLEKIKYDGSYSTTDPEVDYLKFYIEVGGKKYFFPKVEDVTGTKWNVDGKEVSWLLDPNLKLKLWK